MDIQSVLSVFMFSFFVAAVLVRAALLRRRGIRVIVFGQTDKSDFLLAPAILAIAYVVLARAFALPIWEPLIRPFWSTTVPGWIGLLLCGAALAGFSVTLVNFGNSFRVGIDENKPDALVTTGMFAISRNPIYVCFLMFFAGLFLIHRNIVIAVGAVLFALTIHRQVLREERFLSAHYGTDYENYCRRVRRYL